MTRILLVAELPDEVEDVQKFLDSFREAVSYCLERFNLTLYRAAHSDVCEALGMGAENPIDEF